MVSFVLPADPAIFGRFHHDVALRAIHEWDEIGYFGYIHVLFESLQQMRLEPLPFANFRGRR
jgi:hypothetical protein